MTVIGLNFNDEVVSESNKKHIDVGAVVLGARDGGLGCPAAIPLLFFADRDIILGYRHFC